MAPRQALNGTYKLNAFTERTLSESDRAAVSSIYGSEYELAKSRASWCRTLAALMQLRWLGLLCGWRTVSLVA